MLEDSQPSPSQRVRRRRRLILVAGIFALVLAITFGRSSAVQFAQNKARASLRRDELRESTEWLQWAKRLDERNAETSFLLARTCRRLGQLDKAASYLDFSRYSGFDPQRIERERWLMQAQSGQLAEADKHLPILLSDPQGDEREISAAYFEGYRRAGRFQRAAEVLDAWQADFPDDPQPRFLRGVIWNETGFSDRAEAEFRAVFGLRPDYYPALLALAETLVERQQLEEALQCYQRCEEQNPQDREARLGATRCLRLLGRVEEARRSLIAFSEHELTPAVMLEWGCVEIAHGNYDKALTWLKRAYDAQPNNSEVRRQLAMALAGSGQKQEALTHFSFLELVQRNQNKISEYKETVRANAKDNEARLEIARLLFEIEQWEEALVWLYAALEVDPNLSAAHLALADFFEKRQSANSMYAALARQHRAKWRETAGEDRSTAP